MKFVDPDGHEMVPYDPGPQVLFGGLLHVPATEPWWVYKQQDPTPRETHQCGMPLNPKGSMLLPSEAP